jgi:ribose transport system substrate-binding protein
LKPSFRLITVTKNYTNPAYDGARLGVDRMLARLGGTAKHFAPRAPDDVDEQRVLLERAIDERPEAIIAFPTHPTALNPTLRRAKDVGIALFFCVSRADGVDAVSYVSSDNYSPAAAVAERLFQRLGGAGNVAILEGHPNAATSAPRTRGFYDTAARWPSIGIVDCRRGDFQREEGRIAMAAMLAQRSDIDGVLAANDFMALGALEAMEAAGRSMPIVGINAIPEGIDAIKNGRLLATASFDAMKMACIAAEAAARHLRGEAVPPLITLPADIVDAGNFMAWDLPYAERPLPEWNRSFGGAAA